MSLPIMAVSVRVTRHHWEGIRVDVFGGKKRIWKSSKLQKPNFLLPKNAASSPPSSCLEIFLPLTSWLVQFRGNGLGFIWECTSLWVVRLHRFSWFQPNSSSQRCQKRSEAKRSPPPLRSFFFSRYIRLHHLSGLWPFLFSKRCDHNPMSLASMHASVLQHPYNLGLNVFISWSWWKFSWSNQTLGDTPLESGEWRCNFWVLFCS